MKDQKYIENFVNRVENIHEFEYGDFKRKVGLYLNRLEGQLGPSTTKDHKIVLQEIKQSVVYSPNGDIEATREQTVRLARRLMSNN